MHWIKIICRYCLVTIVCFFSVKATGQICRGKIRIIELYVYDLNTFTKFPITGKMLKSLYDYKRTILVQDSVNMIAEKISNLIERLEYCDSCAILDTRILIQLRRGIGKGKSIEISKNLKYLNYKQRIYFLQEDDLPLLLTLFPEINKYL